jgi:hypothetical protein
MKVNPTSAAKKYQEPALEPGRQSLRPGSP